MLSVFVYLVGELDLKRALLELYVLLEPSQSFFVCLVDELDFMSVLLELFELFGLPPLAWSCLVDAWCSWGVIWVGVFLGLPRTAVGARSVLMRCLLAPPLRSCPPVRRAPRRGGGAGAGWAVCGPSPALAPPLRLGGGLVLPS